MIPLSAQDLRTMLADMEKPAGNSASEKPFMPTPAVSPHFAHTSEMVRFQDALRFVSPDALRGNGSMIGPDNKPLNSYWLGVIWAAKREFGDAIKEPLRDWSKQSDRYTDDGFEKAWDEFDPNHPKPVGLGSFYMLATAMGWSNNGQVPVVDGGLHPSEVQPQPLRASPFTWPDPRRIPPRPWVFGRWLLRGAVTGIVAPGGTGKSTAISAMALSLASGRNILGRAVHGGPKRVWLFNLEDDDDELARSITAAAQFHGVTAADCSNHLLVNSGLSGRGLCTAIEDRNGVRICHPEIEALRAELLAKQIDVLIVDPFVSSHTVSENNNTAIDAVVKQWAKVAAAANCSIILSHHSRKLNGTEVTLDAARGASALVNAARSVLVFNRLSTAEAGKFGVSDEERKRIFSIHDDKHNRAPAETADWFYLESVSLKNGDDVGAVRPWTPPSPSAGVTPAQYQAIQQAIATGRARHSSQSPDWAGREVASVLGLDPEKDKNRITRLLKDMTDRGLLNVVERDDSSRQKRKFYEVGASVSFATPAESVAEHGGADEH